MPGLDSRSEAGTRRPTNVTLPEHLLTEARELQINVSQACERGLAEEVKRQRQLHWLGENRSALDAWDDYFEKHGLPLAEFRTF